MERKLSAILAADVVGFCRLMEEDEAATFARLRQHRKELFEPEITKHHGRIFKLMGDGLLAEFASVVDAVECAVTLQRGMAERNTGLAAGERIDMRIGINLGDVIIEGDDRHGEGVNIAARLQELAEPGGICISRTVYNHVKNKLALGFEPMGEQQLKNIAEAMGVYRIMLEPTARPRRVMGRGPRLRYRALAMGGAAAALAVIAAVAVTAWLRPWAPREEQSVVGHVAVPLPDKPSIAVLPFDNISNDPQQAYFADGMTEDLITDLSQLPGIFVISRNSSWTYKGKPVKVRQVAEDLGVRYVLEGSVQRAGDQVRINAQFVDALNDHHLWAKRYDGRMNEVFALQDKVIQQIVAALAINMTTNQSSQIGEAETDSPQAYDALLQGLDHYRRETPEETTKAISYFDKAVEFDHGYSRAHAVLAAAYWRNVNLDWDLAATSEWEKGFELMREHLALALEKPTSIAYRISAEFLAQEGRYDEALAQIERAKTLGPSESDSYISMARILIAMGRAEEAEAATRLALRLNPHNPPDYLRVLGLALFHQKRYEDAAQAMERLVSEDPNVYDDYATLAAIYGYLGRNKDGDTAIKKYNELAVKTGNSQFTVQEQGFWWYGYMYSYDKGYREQLLEGLRKAGVPEGAGTDISYADYSQLMSERDGEYDVKGAIKIDAKTAKALHERGVVFADVRAASMFPLEHIPGAANLDVNTALSSESLSRLVGKNDEVVFSCYGKHCPYSTVACAKAVTWGFTRVYYFAGGFPAWKAAGYPVESGAGQ
jgi:adenylate cyclase